MPTTAKGTPYVVSTDLVANYPTVSSDLADHIDDNLAYNAVNINAQTGTTYTFALADASEGKLVTASNAASSTYTVPPQSSVTWAAGAVLRILNQGAGVVTIAAGSGVTINGTPLTLAQYKGAALQRTASNTWTIIPFSGGVGNANFSDAATGTYTSGGVNYKYITYNASGTLTVTDSGFADILVVGGGGGGGRGGGGAGGHLYATDVYLASGTLTVTVGAGGSGPIAGAFNGNTSRLDNFYSSGGGNGTYQTGGGNGGSGGGAYNNGTAGSGITGLGNAGGGSNSASATGGGGGSSAASTLASGTTGTAGGAGTANSITGSSVTRAGGGGGSGSSANGAGGTGGGGAGSYSGASVAGTANTGGGGGGDLSTGTGANGGSGVVIIRVKV